MIWPSLLMPEYSPRTSVLRDAARQISAGTTTRHPAPIAALPAPRWASAVLAYGRNALLWQAAPYGNRLVAVCSCLRDLIPLAGFLSKDTVINSLRLLVAGAADLHVALQ